uniref:Nucleotidyl transferase AbiEii toxin, Type IV TA system n=1 Tax=Candidatus Kentrum sp. MB TaxID=2138164 RepID=A0A450XI64_9GAMM|nr:MAG: Nucleotidyl transferase AbiEii toxin, Type IV TA system [Candidatus Kentron sp. MB]VFK29561.1 MAG: Nucleotidyl transferase AbiEii toxin, Type IV TA system [Candidatus Kentron sp. MB]VFK74831.1 MAG: Nucleotidyl transferase AbiEii toxin, Type IV TA system [Candidatus Kentron sp. MB]
MQTFMPRLDILPDSQRRLWEELVHVPEDFILYGGTAIALHLGHRQSVDFDFFSSTPFAPDRLYAALPFLAGAEIRQSNLNTLTCLVYRGEPVQVSFFGLPTLGRVAEPVQAFDNNLKIAALIDLAGMKAATVPHRAEAKDYLDIDAILTAGAIDLPTALAAATAIYGEKQFNAQLTLKALCYFEDGDVSSLPREIKARLMRAVDAVDLSRLPILEPVRSTQAFNPGVHGYPIRPLIKPNNETSATQ